MSEAVSRRWVGWLVGVLLLVVVGRLGWLVVGGGMVFESDITALLPVAEDSELVAEVERRVSEQIKYRVVIVVQGDEVVQVDAATDRLADMIEGAIAEGRIDARQVEEGVLEGLAARVEGMLGYRGRLIGDASRRRMKLSGDEQLDWRMRQVVGFPPINVTGPVADPLGTLDEFLQERLGGLRGVEWDGLYLRVVGDEASNLLVLRLGGGGLGSERSSVSARWLGGAREVVMEEFGVRIYMSGVPLHAAGIRDEVVREIGWMTVVAVLLTLGVFLLVTRSLRALVVTVVVSAMGVVSGLVISQGSVGLPHLIGMTMAITAIGICIDFSLHFWVHVRSGMSGVAAVAAIRPALHLSFLTTAIGLLLIAFTSIPVLARSVVFILGALASSWMMLLWVVPRLVGERGEGGEKSMVNINISRGWAVGLTVVVGVVSVVGVVEKYYVDDSPLRLGRRIVQLVEDEQVVRELLGVSERVGLYLVQADSGEGLLEREVELLSGLGEDELRGVSAVSRLVPTVEQQRENKMLFDAARKNISAARMKEYLEVLQVGELDWGAGVDVPYTLQWVRAQAWAELERGRLLRCDDGLCASMVRARGEEVVGVLDGVCEGSDGCERVDFSERQLAAFEGLRGSFGWALVLAGGAILVVLVVRYGWSGFGLFAVPLLAVLSGLAVVAWAGLPVTVFSLAALFPLLGLSVDYVVFAREARLDSKATRLAIFASAVTTSVSFGILAFSSTPAVQYFALPVAVGIVVAWLAVQAMRVRYV